MNRKSASSPMMTVQATIPKPEDEQNSEEHALIKAEIPPIAAGDVEILGVAVAVAELPFERNVVEFGI